MKESPSKQPKPLSRHPAVIVACILSLAALAVVAQLTGENESWKIVAAMIIAWVLGIPAGTLLVKRQPKG